MAKKTLEIIPLPSGAAEIVARSRATHAGLLLDKHLPTLKKEIEEEKKREKYEPSLSQENQKRYLDRVCSVRGDAKLLEHLQQRREQWLAKLPGKVAWTCQTVSALSLHLSRASVLENACICLHPLYGFACLPGSGLKGMARAYAETVWFPTQYERKSPDTPEPANEQEAEKAARAWAKIERVFGWSPNSDKDKGYKPESISKHDQADSSSAGGVVFHDAWPESWPKLFVDILNNHHTDYYQGKGAPGDWENPVPVYFLAVSPGVKFSFALSKRARQSVEDELLALAREWLIGALCHMGAGAKTAAGYGAFVPVEEKCPAMTSPARAAFECVVGLVTPAFLAGAHQEKDDCDLRPATLRGLLRWWWRTMHAADLDVKALRDLEALVWGDTTAGGAVSIRVQQVFPIQCICYNYKDGFKPLKDFALKNELQPPPDKKTTQGLFYLSYGMNEFVNEGGKKVKKQRWYVQPGAQWRVTLTARPARFPVDSKKGKQIPPNALLEQAWAALWLLCHLGGVGSKARKGFGSLSLVSPHGDMDVDRCLDLAARFRSRCGIREQRIQEPESPALREMLPSVEIQTPWRNYWFALDQLGYAVQQFAKQHKHRHEKKALGLPRKIGYPAQGTFNAPKGDRHSAPIHYHFDVGNNGALVVRVAAFPASYLPNWEKSRVFLEDATRHLEEELKFRIGKYGDIGIFAIDTPPHVEEKPVPPKPPIPLKKFEGPQKCKGVIIEKTTTRKAKVKLESGEEIIAAGAKKYQQGDNVIVEETAKDNWRIVEKG